MSNGLLTSIMLPLTRQACRSVVCRCTLFDSLSGQSLRALPSLKCLNSGLVPLCVVVWGAFVSASGR